MKLFSKKRIGAVNKKRFANYILYALGEIILVVIGILIAVAINNWNESKKDDKRLATYLKDYRNDLIIDTTVIAQNIKVLDIKKEAFKLVLSDTMTRESLMQNQLVFSLATTYNPIKLQNKGYMELKNFADQDNTEMDSLVSTIIANHGAYEDLIAQTLKRINDDIDDNLSYFKNNKDWIADLLNAELTDETISYFLSDDYRNRTALHHVLVYGNLYQFLIQYRNYAEEMIEKIDKHLAGDLESKDDEQPKEEDVATETEGEAI